MTFYRPGPTGSKSVYSPVHHNLLNTNSPDIDLDRDVVIMGMEGEMLAEEKSARHDRSIKINILTILISGILFLLILAWFDFLQTAFYAICNPELDPSVYTSVPLRTKFWYAIFATIFILSLVMLLVIANRHITIRPNKPIKSS